MCLKDNLKGNNVSIEDVYVPVLIVGTGIGGLATAYYLENSNIDYMIVAKGNNVRAGNTSLAPANTRVPKPDEINKIVDLSVEKCGASKALIRTIYQNAECVKDFYQEIGLSYDKTVFGVMPVSEQYRPGGRAIVEKLLLKIKQPMIHMELIYFEKMKDTFISYFYHDIRDKIIRVLSYNFVLATGGYGAAFSYNDNHIIATGEGILLAKDAGAKLKGMSTVMYHPWAVQNGKRILVGDIVSLSEGRVVDDKGKQLIKDDALISAIKNNAYHEMFKDILDKEFEIIQAGKKIYLDLREKNEETVKDKLHTYGYSSEILVNGLIEVYPTAHYTSGGVEVNENCEAEGVDNLFVVGEAQFNGDKGCGRLPGQAFTSAVVCGKIIANVIKNREMVSKPGKDENSRDIPKVFSCFYSQENESFEFEKEYRKQLGSLLTFVTSKRVSKEDLVVVEESLEDIERKVYGMHGCRKNFLDILRVYFICCLAKEILADLRTM